MISTTELLWARAKASNVVSLPTTSTPVFRAALAMFARMVRSAIQNDLQATIAGQADTSLRALRAQIITATSPMSAPSMSLADSEITNTEVRMASKMPARVGGTNPLGKVSPYCTWNITGRRLGATTMPNAAAPASAWAARLAGSAGTLPSATSVAGSSLVSTHEMSTTTPLWHLVSTTPPTSATRARIRPSAGCSRSPASPSISW